jgi:hypothetical protein
MKNVKQIIEIRGDRRQAGKLPTWRTSQEAASLTLNTRLRSGDLKPPGEGAWGSTLKPCQPLSVATRGTAADREAAVRPGFAAFWAALPAGNAFAGAAYPFTGREQLRKRRHSRI